MTTRCIKLLIVENSKKYINALGAEFLRRQNAIERRFGRFQPIVVRTAEDALKHLEAALEAGEPFHVMLTDVGLPKANAKTEADLEYDSLDVGHELLKAIPKGSAQSVAVMTSYTNAPVLIGLLNSGIIDSFFAKVEEPSAAVDAVLQAYLRGQERLWLQLQEQRLRSRLIFQACGDVADRLCAIVSDGTSEVLSETSATFRLLEDQYQLNSHLDAESPIWRSIDRLREFGIKLLNDCTKARANIVHQSGSPTIEKICLDDLISEVITEVWPGVVCRGLHLEQELKDQHFVHTYREDLKMVVQEMLYGAVGASQKDRSITTGVELSEDGLTMRIWVADQAEPIDMEAAERIRERKPVEIGVGRVSGLALAQRLAGEIGGLDIEASEQGNKVIFRIRLSKHDNIADNRKQSTRPDVLSKRA